MDSKQDTSRKWKKIEPQRMRWDKPGDQVEGTLVEKEQSVNYDNMVYKIQDAVSGDIVTVYGTTVINQRLKGVAIGKMVRIVYLGTEPNENPKLNDTMLFEVWVAE